MKCATEFVLNSQEQFGAEQIQYNMERIGYRVGFSLVEKATKDEARFKEDVEIVKYICKVWHKSKYRTFSIIFKLYIMQWNYTYAFADVASMIFRHMSKYWWIMVFPAWSVQTVFDCMWIGAHGSLIIACVAPDISIQSTAHIPF